MSLTVTILVLSGTYYQSHFKSFVNRDVQFYHKTHYFLIDRQPFSSSTNSLLYMKPPIRISVVSIAPCRTLSELAQYSVLKVPFNIILPSVSRSAKCHSHQLQYVLTIALEVKYFVSLSYLYLFGLIIFRSYTTHKSCSLWLFYINLFLPHFYTTLTNSAVRSWMISTPRQILFGWSKREESNGRGM